MIDKLGRDITYLRISLTDKCNLRCRYCMPEEGVCKRSHHEMMNEDVLEYAIFKLMDGIVMSGEEKVIKPDLKIYHILLNRYQLIPEECVFFDDNINNVTAARNIGIHAIQFQSMEQAKESLSLIMHS